MSNSVPNHTSTGNRGEEIACKVLISKGYSILNRNYRKGRAEIDIITENEENVVFVEVKSRSNYAYGSGLKAVSAKKQTLIIEAAESYLEAHEIDKDIRFDIILIDLKQMDIEHIEDAFRSEF